MGLLEVPQRESDVPNSPEMMADLPLLAEYILVEGQYTRERLEQHILQQVHTMDADPTAMHRALARLPVDQIWTTNYDPLIEQAAETSRVISVDDDIQLIGASRQVIIKMHGSIDPGPPPQWASAPVIRLFASECG